MYEHMDIAIHLHRSAESAGAGVATVGWFFIEDEGSVVFYPPERVKFRSSGKVHAKSAARCPGILQMESRYFLIRCPYDLHLGFTRGEKGNPLLVNRNGSDSSIRNNALRKIIHIVPESEWRYSDRPTIQLVLPYCFTCEETCFITQLDAFAHYRKNPLPGTIFGGRFPIHAWIRPLMWGFEWHDIEKDIVLKRGDPLFYCQFEVIGPERPIQLIPVERTPEIEKWVSSMSAVANYVNQTFELFRQSLENRPEKLLVPKKSRG